MIKSLHMYIHTIVYSTVDAPFTDHICLIIKLNDEESLHVITTFTPSCIVQLMLHLWITFDNFADVELNS